MDAANMIVRPVKWHELKTWPEEFGWTISGGKTFELRVNDRGYQSGDVLHLREWDPTREEYTGRSVSRQVVYILAGGKFGLPENMVIMQLVMV